MSENLESGTLYTIIERFGEDFRYVGDVNLTDIKYSSRLNFSDADMFYDYDYTVHVVRLLRDKYQKKTFAICVLGFSVVELDKSQISPSPSDFLPRRNPNHL